MKKLFAILAVAGFLTACNDGGAAEEVKKDTLAAPATVDTTVVTTVDTTVVKTDTTVVKADTTVKH